MLQINRLPATLIECGGSHAEFLTFLFFGDVYSDRDLIGHRCAIYVLRKVIGLEISGN